MTVETILAELKTKGNEGVKKIFLKHGIKEPFFGVKIEDLKVIQKKINKDYQLAKDLYATGNADAMYLAGLIADETKMTKNDLAAWVKKAESSSMCNYIVPWIAAESKFGFELALEWIDFKTEFIAVAGWSTLSSLVAIKPDEELDLKALKSLLSRAEKNIHKTDNEIRKAMNIFIIAVGSYVTSLTNEAITVGQKIVAVQASVGDTACKIPDAVAYINKVKAKGYLGKKKKMARC
jgi:3-methyladenine DNA glycosylase AlkD